MADRLLQHRAPDGTRSVILARGDQAAFVPGVESVVALAQRAIAEGKTLLETALACGEGKSADLAAELAASASSAASCRRHASRRSTTRPS